MSGLGGVRDVRPARGVSGVGGASVAGGTARLGATLRVLQQRRLDGARRDPQHGRGRGTRLAVGVGFVALVWLVEAIDLLLFRGALDGAGIRPRTEGGLWGIVFAPFLHDGPAHLIANTVPLLVLGWLVAMRGLRDWLWVTVVAALVGGLGVWLFGRPATVHLGASGLIFGYLGYLLLRGFWERSLVAVGIALVAGTLYGGALWGALPGQRGVSWEGHLFGLAGGAGAASVHRRRPGPVSL